MEWKLNRMETEVKSTKKLCSIVVILLSAVQNSLHSDSVTAILNNVSTIQNQHPHPSTPKRFDVVT